MKTTLNLLIFLLCLFSINGLYSQPSSSYGPVVPYQQNGSPIFGKDITVFDRPTHDQRHIAICSAFNGWLYAAQSSDSAGYAFAEIFKSTDNGLTWTRIVNAYASSPSMSYADLDLVVIGNTESNLKLFLGSTLVTNTGSYYSSYVTRFNGLTGGAYEDELLKDLSDIHDLSLATDYPYPANNANPSSLAVLYSVSNLFGPDSVILRTSSNGGMSFDGRKVIAVSNKYFHKVSLSYGFSLSWNSGKYFASWEEQQNKYSNLGHIFGAHTINNFNSSFTKPVCLDSLEPSAINMVRNPSISCQTSSSDNDSVNITEVVLFEKKKPVGEDYDITGYYNLQSATTSHFRPLDLAITSNKEVQPDINFNAFDSTFMVTYYDSTDQKLPFLIKNFNLVNPNSWNVVSNGYNDASSLSTPHPKVQVSYGQSKGANVWTRELGGGIGASMFDACYSTYTGIPKTQSETDLLNCKIYPDPCDNLLTVSFELLKKDVISITIYDLYGRVMLSFPVSAYSAGRNSVTIDVSTLSSGSYIYSIRTGTYSKSGRIIIIR
jgi:hypothetical protein